MIHPSVIEARLGELRFKCSRWFKAEVSELQHVLMEHEKIIALACGRYFGSFALLVATDQRLLMIDKRVFFMNMESTPYDMISEIDYNAQSIYANLTVYTVNKTHKFTTVKYRQQLRDITNYIQKRVAELRNQAVPMPPSVQAAQAHATGDDAVPAHLSTARPQPVDQPADAPAPAAAAAMPPLGTAYNYSPAASDDSAAAPAFDEHSPEVAQMVGQAAVQATHHWPRRPFNPYVQGSLMTRHPYGRQYMQ